jgi:hypothetical protein
MKKDIQKLLDEKKIDQATFDKMMKDFDKVISERDAAKKESKDSRANELTKTPEKNKNNESSEILSKIDKRLESLENNFTTSKNSEILKNAGMKESIIQKFVNDKDVMENVENHKKENSYLYDSEKTNTFVSKEGGSTSPPENIDGLSTEEIKLLESSFNPNNI